MKRKDAETIAVVFRGKTLRKGEYLDVSRWHWLRVESASRGKVRLSYAEEVDSTPPESVESRRQDNL